MKQTDTDFGWRYKGRWVGVYRDLSRDGTPEPIATDTRPRECGNTLTCLQCGICTAQCHLASNNTVFPRREMSLVQGGLADRAALLPSIWQCYQCDDCTEGCPSLAGPSEVMAQLRERATTDFSVFPDFARLLHTKAGFGVMFGFALLIMAILGINFSNHVWTRDAVVFSAMYPHHLLLPFFAAVTLFSLALVVLSVTKAWRRWCNQTPAMDNLNGPRLRQSIRQALSETVLHHRFDACEANRYRRWAHVLIMLGFTGLCGIALFAAVAPVFHIEPKSIQTPFTPFKLIANGFSGVLIVGIAFFLYYRISKLRQKSTVTFMDWIFPVLLAVVVLSGLFSQWARWANVGVIAYPVYLIHLSSVLILIIMLPFSKPAHALYRVMAEVHRLYLENTVIQEAVDSQQTQRQNVLRDGATSQTPVANIIDIGSVIDAPFLLSHESARQLSDAVIINAYNSLRDAFEEVNGDKRFHQIENLYGTAFEREKDRRELTHHLSLAKDGELSHWYRTAAMNPCSWWLQNHLLARHSLKSCMFCGMCTAVCPAAEHYTEYNPRSIVDAALSGDESELVTLLQSDTIWYCGQCGACRERCPRGNSIMGLISSLRVLSQLKGFHIHSNRGRQQYASRYLWGSNFWNRGCSLYFRNGDKWAHPDFGPNYEKFFDHQEQEFLRLGATPDRPGAFGGRKINPETLKELRSLVDAGGTLYLWKKVDEFGNRHRDSLRLSEEAYLEMVAKEG